MFLSSQPWLFDLWGRLHPMLVHFPIGLLVGALLLESWHRIKGKEGAPNGMIYLGALTAVISATMGGLLKASGDYGGTLVDQHQFTGYLTAVLALLTAYLYWKKGADRVAYISLWLSCLGVGVAGHMGAGLTHGPDYLSSVLPWNRYQPTDAAALQAFQAFAESDSFPSDQLDKLNLEVRAIFAHNCYQCHSTEKQKGDLVLDEKEGVFAGGESGPVIVNGKADESELIRRLELPRAHDEAMPPKGKTLQKEEIALIRLWIDQGAHWADSTLKVFREAELALTKPAIPQSPASIPHPVDRFVNQYFEKNDLPWPKLIDDRQFIRRAYLDVVGLLPSPEKVAAFLADEAMDKRKRLIDELLADKQSYAMHWLSFWNDLLRNDYSGTGFITGGRKQITEWLYTALLEGKPYDRMATELINPTPESEGFIRGIQWRGEVNSSQRTELQAAQNISQSLLGLNLKCASCHNSFVNNLTLDQAYGFANIFAERPLEVHRCDKPTGRLAETSFLYPQLGEVNADSLKQRLQQLATVIVQPANGRLYRTVVNRYWDRLLGRGIVAPVDEMDNLPWSQELLDWLAADFMDHGYDFHHLLRQIMTSRTYQLPAVAYPSPEYLASEQFVFQGPVVRRLTAEQFVDAFSQTVDPFYYGLAYDPTHRQVDAQWIWHEEIELDRRVLPKPGQRRFRKQFTIDQGNALQRAEVLITADHAYTFWLNEKKISQGTDWREVERLNLPIDLLEKDNIIAIAGTNEGVIPNPAGLLFSLRLQYADGSIAWIHSDPSWKSSTDTLVQNWTALEFDDLAWNNAWRAGSFQNSYWGRLLSFSFSPDSTAMPFARAALVRQDDFMKTLGRPVRENVTTSRSDEATLLQSLMLTNSQFFHEHLSRGAAAWWQQADGKPEKLLDELYQKALGRLPAPKEKKLLLKKLEQDESEAALEDIIWTLVLLPEFQLI